MNTANQKPSFIVLCGGEGSGKSTIVKALKDAYKIAPDGEETDRLITTREPGGSEYAESIRDLMFNNPLGKQADAETMFGLFWAARADHLAKKIGPLIKEGISIVSDRFDCCTFAYQIYGQEQRQLTELFWAMRKHYLREYVPDIYIFLDVNVKEGLKRVAGRPGKKNHFDDRDMAFHERIREGYLDFIKEVTLDGDNAVIVDANRPLADVRGEVLDIVGEMVS